MKAPFTTPDATHTITSAPVRGSVVVRGRVARVVVVGWAGGPVVEATLRDVDAGADPGDELTLVFLGRRTVGGLEIGCHLTAAAVVARHRGRRVLLNPQLWLEPARTVPIPRWAVAPTPASVVAGPTALVPA
jgi:hypothetical protein